ncbi:hypothetical protein [Streptomyces kanamyceticus]|uniref:hypothetical protein n=1 Tax=Streptomyces kanamyceticus TaxID=1967 RepID=UPI000AF7824A|nr:hypothetical protein [Streptomyces kanamyceticus]
MSIDPLTERTGLTSEERRLRGSIAANSMWSKIEDRTAHTAAARRAFMDRFEVEVDPDGSLSPQERATRAESARRAHFQRLALASAKARRARRTKGGASDAA